jgi:cytochrome c
MSRRFFPVAFGLIAISAAAAEAILDGLGRPATADDIARHGSLVGPTGVGLPPGRGTAMQGRALYLERCAGCHGARGEGTDDFPALVGGRGTLGSRAPELTVGSYWPFATTIWDYVNRAMPYPAPGTLQPDEVYALTAYLLAANQIVAVDLELNERTLPTVRMPNRDGFVPDPRPDVK